MNAVDLVPMDESQPDGRPDGRIHACSRSSHVQNGQREIGLRGRTVQSGTEKLIFTSLNKDINFKGGHLSFDWLLKGQNLVDVPVVLKTPVKKSQVRCQGKVSSLRRYEKISKSFTTFHLSPAAQLDGFIEPLLIHGFLHQLRLQIKPTEC